MTPLGQFDPDLEMFVEPEHDFDYAVLSFWRWLREHGRLTEDMDPAD